MSDDRLTEAAELVDLIYSYDDTIKGHEAAIAAVKQTRAQAEDRLRLLVEGTGVTEVAGRNARATFGLKSVPKVVDWQEVYSYIQLTGAWDLLHKRLGAKAWEERINAGAYVPGIEQIVVPVVTVKGKR